MTRILSLTLGLSIAFALAFGWQMWRRRARQARSHS
mgnify:CR=1 FL=1